MRKLILCTFLGIHGKQYGVVNTGYDGFTEITYDEHGNILKETTTWTGVNRCSVCNKVI